MFNPRDTVTRCPTSAGTQGRSQVPSKTKLLILLKHTHIRPNRNYFFFMILDDKADKVQPEKFTPNHEIPSVQSTPSSFLPPPSSFLPPPSAFLRPPPNPRPAYTNQINTNPQPYPNPIPHPAPEQTNPHDYPQLPPTEPSYSVTDVFGGSGGLHYTNPGGFNPGGAGAPNHGSGYESPQIVRADYGTHINGVSASEDHNQRANERPGAQLDGGVADPGAPSWGSTSTGISSAKTSGPNVGFGADVDYQLNAIDDTNPKYRPDYPRTQWKKHTNQYSKNEQQSFGGSGQGRRPYDGPREVGRPPVGSGARRFDAVAPDSAERSDYVYDDLYDYEDEPKPSVRRRDPPLYRIPPFLNNKRSQRAPLDPGRQNYRDDRRGSSSNRRDQREQWPERREVPYRRGADKRVETNIRPSRPEWRYPRPESRWPPRY